MPVCRMVSVNRRFIPWLTAALFSIGGAVPGAEVPGTSVAHADTFAPQALAPESGVENLTQGMAQRFLDRKLFGNPYASVLFGSVDIYDVFPYVESRHFVAVTDPSWNRIVVTDTKQKLIRSFDGKGTESGPLQSPRGVAVDPEQNLYVCDTENNRIVILKASVEFDDVNLSVVDVIEGLGRPYDVAHSDNGTPFDPTDDRIYVAETGMNRLVRFAKEGTSFVRTGEIGGLGSGVGRFAGPMAVAVGRTEGVCNGQVYVADVHNQRVVRIDDRAGDLQWDRETPFSATLVTSLDTDHWGQVYVTSPEQETVVKLSPNLSDIAVLREGITQPKSFHIPFVNVTDHRTGERTRAGEAHGLLVEKWGPTSGLRLWSLGMDVEELQASAGEGVEAQFRLTDPAWVSARLVDAKSGETVAFREEAFLLAGSQKIRFEQDDVVRPLESGAYHVEVVAKAGYEDGDVVTAQTQIDLIDVPVGMNLSRPFFLGSSPNPFRPQTNVRFYLPEPLDEPAVLSVFDLSGRLVHRLSQGVYTPGIQSMPWNGKDERGLDVHSGVYYYKVTAGSHEWSGKTVRVQ